MTAPATPEVAFTARAGALCLVAGLLGLASAIFLAVVPPEVDDDVYSYPLASGAFAGIQAFFFVQHLALVAGLVALWRARPFGPGRAGPWGLAGASAGMVLLAVVELIAIGAADSPYPSPRTDTLDMLYGVSSVVIGVGLLAAGSAVVRARRWQGWRRALPLATGVYVFVPMTPAIMGPFVLGRIAIGIWMLMFAALGWALLRPTRRPDPIEQVPQASPREPSHS